MKKPLSYATAYGIFCIAMQLDIEELDLKWERATQLYRDFLASDYNDYSKSEVDCIYEYLNSKK